jgi:hypothetical protein
VTYTGGPHIHLYAYKIGNIHIRTAVPHFMTKYTITEMVTYLYTIVIVVLAMVSMVNIVEIKVPGSDRGEIGGVTTCNHL